MEELCFVGTLRSGRVPITSFGCERDSDVQDLSIDGLQASLEAHNYVADRALAVSLFLCLRLRKPIFLEGEAGVGKTEVAKVLSMLLERRLIRLQCYEGLDVSSAVYEWNYSRQMLEIRLLEARKQSEQEAPASNLFGPQFLLKRPLLEAIDHDDPEPPVLLIDELDRADEEFEAFLLELLSDFQVSIPEIGTIRAKQPPIVVITSNRTREIHDALKRRCLYHWIDYPSFDKELAIVEVRCPGASRELASQVVSFVQQLRKEDLFKLPGVAETIDWVNALVALNELSVRAETIDETLGVLLKYQDDVELVRGQVAADILQRGTSTPG